MRIVRILVRRLRRDVVLVCVGIAMGYFGAQYDDLMDAWLAVRCAMLCYCLMVVEIMGCECWRARCDAVRSVNPG